MPSAGKGVVALLLAALVLPACGGGDDGDGGDRGSREDYAQQVSEVCADVERELSELSIADPETSAEVSDVFDEVIAKSRAALNRLKALERPSGDAGETADRFVETLEREFEAELFPALGDLGDAIRNGDREAAANAAERLAQLENTESGRLARELGADACAT
jgi:hypothetical protein